MGRYYDGDISGKFWFAVQSSDDADFFGGQQSEPNCIDYHFEADDLPTIKDGLKACIEALGENRAKLDAFFKDGGEGSKGYTDKSVATYLGLDWNQDDSFALPSHPVRNLLEWYARIELGEKIRACVVETGECNFEVEL